MDSHFLRICETFTSLQGEGLHAGLPCFFIRLSGCNLRCLYCDTGYARAEEGEPLQLDVLLSLWRASRVSLVQITGGEPLLQSGVYHLMGELVRSGAEVLLETNGTIPMRQVPRGVVKVVDWKTPGSGHGDSFLLDNLALLSADDQVQFVITSREDYEWSLSKVETYRLDALCSVLFSPAWSTLSPRLLAEWIIEDRAHVRFQIQLHKILWGDERFR